MGTAFEERLSIIEAELRRARGDGAVPQVIAVSKTQPAEVIEEALKSGHRLFGENRVQEAEAKWPELRARYAGVELHLIGALQSNKAEEAVALFDVIQVVDRRKLVDALVAASAKLGRRPVCYVQVNIGEEEQKAGCAPGEVEELVAYARDVGLDVRGVMCIPPADAEPGLFFALMANLRKRLGLEWLSMGMSGDYREAARFGATHVRIGTALFGARA